MNHSKINSNIGDCGVKDHFDNSSYFEDFIDSTFNEKANNEKTDNNKSAFNVSALCCDEELNGYDKLTGQNWIYPTNYPVRDYQFNIIKASLLNNTLVSLPTGLGKTFIAAVVIYNFYRWYPLGKIVFVAPTRPLVAQQIEACYNIVAIPKRDTIEMTGHMQVNTRQAHWQTKRVFFATPQVIYNDIQSGICPGEKLRCLVIDEAHKARGNYAYCKIISTLTDMGHTRYRVLALSATPGSKVEDVVNVVTNLHISHLELRTEQCLDVRTYVHSRKINTEVIELGPELTQLRNQYVEILDVYARRLKQLNILPQNLGNISRGQVVMLYKEYQNRERSARHPQHNYIMKDFTVLISLNHGLELLVKHGSRVFLNYFDEHSDKSWIHSDDRLTSLLETLREHLGTNPLSLNRSVLPDGTVPEIPKNLSFGHPKFYRLQEIIVEHFTAAKSKGEDTRAIVFCEYRESVNLVYCLLLQCRPLVRPQMFVGQGPSGREGGITQRAQTRALLAFRSGAVNVLVSTCVAEEGLDVGAVDLCVCFDVSTRSPVRLVQRCGRTGRARGGQIYMLVTEGREHQLLLESMRQRDGLNSKIQQSVAVQNNLYKMNPRMIPRDFTPECKKMFITVKQTPDTNEKSAKKKSKKGQKDFIITLQTRLSDETKDIVTKEEFDFVYPEGYQETDMLAAPTEYWCKSPENIKEIANVKGDAIKLSKWLDRQKTEQATAHVGHSTDTQTLVSLLQYCDEKRFEIAPKQDPNASAQCLSNQKSISSPVKSKPTTKRKQKVTLIKSPAKKDGDIRALFSTTTKSTKNYTKLLKDLGIQNDGSIPTRLVSLLVDLSIENTNMKKECYICYNICNCNIIQNIRKGEKQSRLMLPIDREPKLPDLNLIEDFDADLIKTCNETIIDAVDDDDDIQQKDEIKCKEDISEEDVNCSKNFDLRFDFDSISDSPKASDMNVEEKNTNINKNFDIGDIEDIFCESSPEEASNQNINTEPNRSNSKETLNFFGLDSIEDIFADSDDEGPKEAIENEQSYVNEYLKPTMNITLSPKGKLVDEENRPNSPSNKTGLPSPDLNPKSPSILSGRCVSNNQVELTSPILCSQTRKFKLSTNKNNHNKSLVNVKNRLSLDFNKNHSLPSPHKDSNQTLDSLDVINNKSLTITELVQMIDGNESSVSKITNNLVTDNQATSLNERSISPTILTQRDKIKKNNSEKSKSQIKNKSENPSNQSKQYNSVIVLEDENDPNDTTQEYKVDNFTLDDESLIYKRDFSFSKFQKKTLLSKSITDKEDLKEKSMLTITQVMEMIARQNESTVSGISNVLNTDTPKQKIHQNIESSSATTPLRTKISNYNETNKTKFDDSQASGSMSIIILDSDSDSLESTSEKQLKENEIDDKDFKQVRNSQIDSDANKKNNKRKLDNFEISNSPYFNKKPKLSNISTYKPLTLQEKVIAALNCNKSQPDNFPSNDKRINFISLQPKYFSQKENQNPLYTEEIEKEEKSCKEERPDPIKMLQMFQRKKNTPRKITSSLQLPTKRKMLFDNSNDDDFVDNAESHRSPKISQTKKNTSTNKRRLANYKARKKKGTAAQFIDDEAELSSDDGASCDELSEGSDGSIADFICDSPARNHSEVDMHAYYMKSVKSPIRGVFKIPELPKTFNKYDVLSQYEEEDTYAMDSFCVDSHIGLTQVDEMSELEEAERVLEQKRRRRKNVSDNRKTAEESGDSTILRRPSRTVRRTIDSDSEESEDSEEY